MWQLSGSSELPCNDNDDDGRKEEEENSRKLEGRKEGLLTVIRPISTYTSSCCCCSCFSDKQLRSHTLDKFVPYIQAI